MFRSAALILILILALPCSATVLTVSTGKASFEGSLTNLKTIDFENIIPQGFSNAYYNTTPLGPIQGVTFTNSGGGDQMYVNSSGLFTVGSGAYLVGPNPPGYILVAFATAVSGVGFDASTYFGGTITFTTGGTSVTTSNVPAHTSSTWVGFTSDTPFTSLEIQVSNAGARAALDNFEFGNAAADTPEVATILMIGTGLLALGGGRRWLHRPSSSV